MKVQGDIDAVGKKIDMLEKDIANAEKEDRN